ncbi:tRNA (adenosine(37)-N6)-threonylcarbamoyltransferase complex ATPase subunit type 1 TsaE [Micrococcales bacterium 31B]|nr:tRNA (adenosine(37)-N6)-threonylcarbamoyltransferase complex ATPase subunit type 1 TsaE [Micrococcales bacterium 31B]
MEIYGQFSLEVRDPSHTQAVAEALSDHLASGDVIVLTGELGAGKTTFTQGLGRGLGVRGPVASPTFVISRVHPSLVGGPELVHVDAYRLGSALEVDDLDLDTDLKQAVTVIEWGRGLAEGLSDDRLEIVLVRELGYEAPSEPNADGLIIEPRRLDVHWTGARWARVAAALEASLRAA